MKITPPELESPDSSYVLEEVLEHDQMIAFLKTHGKQAGVWLWRYRILNLLFFLLLTVLSSYYLAAGKLSGDQLFQSVSLGFAATFLCIPLHEYLHVLAYRSQGAKNTSYGVDWKHLVFMALADEFVAGYKEFRVIALTPFFCISLLAIVGALVSPVPYSIGFLTALLIHSSFCYGDFGLLNYMKNQGQEDVVTFDRVGEKKTYFYKRKKVS